MLRRLLIPLARLLDARLSQQVEYLLAENRILRSKIQGPVRLDDRERRRLASLGVRLGRKLLEVLASIAKPDTILHWHRRLVERKPPKPGRAGRPMVPWDTRDLVARIARETVHVAGLTTNPRESRVLQSARNLTMAG